MNRNLDFLNSFVNISEETFAKIQNITTFKKIEAGTQIVKLDEVSSKLYMLVSIVIRCYLSTESGKEFNKSFYLPISFVASLKVLLKQKP